MIPHVKPEIGQEEIEAMTRVAKSGWFGRGPETEAFEKEFSRYIAWNEDGVLIEPYCLFTNSCTSALKMAYKYFKELEKRCFYTEFNTYCATFSAGCEMGLERCLDSKPINIPPHTFPSYPIKVNVHFGGVKDNTPCSIEDSAHRIEPNDPLVGEIRCYSFHPNKNMTTGYSGGMFVTTDKEIYEKAKLWINDGLVRTGFGRFDYTIEAYAGGYEGFDISAAFGREQLKKLPEFNRKRNELVKRYNEAFSKNWVGNHIFPLYLKNYNEVKMAIVELEKQGISCKSHYPGSNVLTLPLFPSLTYEQQDEVIEKVKTVCREKSILL